MNKCLITKLKASVDNDNLERLGMLKFMASGLNAAGFIDIRCDGATRVYTETPGAKLKIVGAGAQGVQVSDTEVLINSSTTGICSEGADPLYYYVEKYNLTEFPTIYDISKWTKQITTKDIKYCTKLRSMQGIADNAIVGDFEDLMGLDFFSTKFIWVRQEGLTGNIMSFLKNPNLTWIEFYNTGIRGDVTGFLNKLSETKKSGKLQLMPDSRCVNIPEGIVSNYSEQSFVTFTQDGWHVG